MSVPDRLAITIAQLNPIVGDVAGNADKARGARARGAAAGADLILLPELFVCGYPPEDLVLKPALQAACRAAVEMLALDTADGGPAMLIGTPWVDARTRQFSRRAPRRSDLRGHLGPGAGRMHRRDRRRDSAGAERLALPARRNRRAAQRGGGPRHGGGPAARLREPG